jgi:hypothetical protein
LSFEFFTDRNCGCHVFPEALRGAGIIVHRHRDHFRDDVEDDAWLPEVAERGWIALSFDKAIRKNELERNAVFLSGARLIQLRRQRRRIAAGPQLHQHLPEDRGLPLPDARAVHRTSETPQPRRSGAGEAGYDRHVHVLRGVEGEVRAHLIAARSIHHRQERCR